MFFLCWHFARPSFLLRSTFAMRSGFLAKSRTHCEPTSELQRSYNGERTPFPPQVDRGQTKCVTIRRFITTFCRISWQLYINNEKSIIFALQNLKTATNGNITLDKKQCNVEEDKESLEGFQPDNARVGRTDNRLGLAELQRPQKRKTTCMPKTFSRG